MPHFAALDLGDSVMSLVSSPVSRGSPAMGFGILSAVVPTRAKHRAGRAASASPLLSSQG